MCMQPRQAQRVVCERYVAITELFSFFKASKHRQRFDQVRADRAILRLCLQRLAKRCLSFGGSAHLQADGPMKSLKHGIRARPEDPLTDASRFGHAAAANQHSRSLKLSLIGRGHEAKFM